MVIRTRSLSRPRRGLPRPAGMRGALSHGRDERGYTLLEVLTIVAMLGIVMSAGFLFYRAAVGRASDTQERKDTLEVQRTAIDRIARDVRESEVVAVRASSGGGATTTGNVVDAVAPHERVIYDCTTGTCTRTVTDVAGSATLDGPDEVIGDLDVSEPVFSTGSSYDGADGSFVRVRLSILPPSRAKPIVLTRGVAIRNDCAAPGSPVLPAC